MNLIWYPRLYRPLEPILASVLPVIDKSYALPDDVRERIQHRLASQICQSLDGIRFLYKSRNYGYENECRVVRTESKGVDPPTT